MEATTLQDVRERILKGLTSGAVKYDLGCGQVPLEGFIGVDLTAKGERVINADLFATPWPIADESVDYFYTCHFLEHVPDWDAHFAEVYRCLKMGGFYEFRAPYYWNTRWFQDPNHRQPILHQRFAYLDREWLKANKIEHDHPPVNFTIFENQWFELLNDDYRVEGGETRYSPDAIEWAKKHSINVIDDLAAILVKLPLE